MKLILAVASDGTLAKGPDDDMRWTGAFDKALFKMLTSVGGICFAGARTRDLMPKELPGRRLITITSKPWVRKLKRFDEETMSIDEVLHLDGLVGGVTWCIGGQAIATELFMRGAITEVHLLKQLHDDDHTTGASWSDLFALETSPTNYHIANILLLMRASAFGRKPAASIRFKSDNLEYTCWRNRAP